jgi:cysteine-rich repeat protein
LCSASNQCQSGNCTDGFCCNTACGGTCQACDLAGSVGTCGNIPAGQDPANECAGATNCNGAGGCGTVCGDGIVQGSETCDDANAVNGDGCSNTCNVEPGFNCVGQPSVCVGVCGDGIRVGAEQCDDANVANGDGCSSSCNVEVGFSCAGQPSVCTAICGDGIQVGAEQCDDGNVTNGDGCSSVCTIELACALLKVNELVTGTTASATDEFIEVFNPCYVPVNLGGWKLVYRAAAGTSDTVFVAWSGTTIQPRSYLLYAGSAYGGANDGVYSTGSMAAAGGGVAVRNSTNAVVDSVGYGTATNIFVEGAAVAAPPVVAPPGRSIGRFPNGVDTNQNSVDFHLTTSVTPRAANN